MKARRLIRLAWGLWGLVIASLAGTVPFGLADPVGTAEQGGMWIYVTFTAFVLTFSTVGVLIVTRQPGNPIGWLLVACAVGYALAGLTNAYSSYGLHTRPGELPGVPLAAVVSGGLFLVAGDRLRPSCCCCFPPASFPRGVGGWSDGWPVPVWSWPWPAWCWRQGRSAVTLGPPPTRSASQAARTSCGSPRRSGLLPSSSPSSAPSRP
jgi:hypothetical protein